MCNCCLSILPNALKLLISSFEAAAEVGRGGERGGGGDSTAQRKETSINRMHTYSTPLAKFFF
jgi:hypothetical protein